MLRDLLGELGQRPAHPDAVHDYVLVRAVHRDQADDADGSAPVAPRFPQQALRRVPGADDQGGPARDLDQVDLGLLEVAREEAHAAGQQDRGRPLEEQDRPRDPAPLPVHEEDRGDGDHARRRGLHQVGEVPEADVTPVSGVQPECRVRQQPHRQDHRQRGPEQEQVAGRDLEVEPELEREPPAEHEEHHVRRDDQHLAVDEDPVDQHRPRFGPEPAQRVHYHHDVAPHARFLGVGELDADFLGQDVRGVVPLRVPGLREQAGLVPVAERGRVGDPRRLVQDPALVRCVEVDEALDLGPRPDQRHVTGEDVDELGQLVHLEAADPVADPGDAGVGTHREQAILLGAHPHAAELEHREEAPAPAHPALAVEDRAPVVERDQHGDHQEQRGEQDEPHRRAADIEKPLDRHRITGGIVRRRPAPRPSRHRRPRR